MLLVLPALGFALLAAGFHRKGMGRRESVLFASIPWALFLTCITELLTQVHSLTRTGVAVSWLAFAVVCLVWMQRMKRADLEVRGTDDVAAPGWSDKIGLGLILLMAALIGLTALASAPNTWDAMEYHLPRGVEWMNNRGVQFYPTIDRFQLDQAAFAEYAMMHFDLLYGSDRVVALVQWFGYLGCILASSFMAKELGGRSRAQIVQAFGDVVLFRQPVK